MAFNWRAPQRLPSRGGLSYGQPAGPASYPAAGSPAASGPFALSAAPRAGVSGGYTQPISPGFSTAQTPGGFSTPMAAPTGGGGAGISSSGSGSHGGIMAFADGGAIEDDSEGYADRARKNFRRSTNIEDHPNGLGTRFANAMQGVIPWAGAKAGGAGNAQETGGIIPTPDQMVDIAGKTVSQFDPVNKAGGDENDDVAPGSLAEQAGVRDIPGQGLLQQENADTDKTTHAIDQALDKVQNVFDRGRQQFGLDQSQQQDNSSDTGSDQGIPDDSATGYADGGDVGDGSDDDTTGAVDQQPAVPDPSGDQSQQVPQLAAYVQGAGATDPQQTQSILQQYGHLPIEQATVQALADVSEQAQNAAAPTSEGMPTGQVGEDASVGLLQSYRQHYDHGRAYAYAALTGNQQKPANIDDSLKAANDAFPYVPDGERVNFSKGQNGSIHVAVGGPKGEQRFQADLSPQQYAALLTQSDFDKVYERTPALLIQEILRQPQTNGVTTGPNQPQQPQPDQANLPTGANPTAQQGGAPQGNKEVVPGRTDDQGNVLTPDNHKGYNVYHTPRGDFYVPEALDAQSHAMTGGWISKEPQRMQWLAEQMQQGTKNRIDEMKARNPLGVQQLRNQGNLERTQFASNMKAMWEDNRTRAQLTMNLQKIAASHQNEQARNAARLAQSALVGGVDPETVPDVVKKMTGVDMSSLLNLGQNNQQQGGGEAPAPVRGGQATPYGGKNTQVERPTETRVVDGKVWYRTGNGWSDAPQSK